jgi:hypothetical protein
MPVLDGTGDPSSLIGSLQWLHCWSPKRWPPASALRIDDEQRFRAGVRPHQMSKSMHSLAGRSAPHQQWHRGRPSPTLVFVLDRQCQWLKLHREEPGVYQVTEHSGVVSLMAGTTQPTRPGFGDCSTSVSLAAATPPRWTSTTFSARTAARFRLLILQPASAAIWSTRVGADSSRWNADAAGPVASGLLLQSIHVPLRTDGRFDRVLTSRRLAGAA